MIRLLTIPALVIAMMSIGTGGATAERYWPWCSRYGWSTICSYATFQQCQASVSGAGGYCTQNVMPPPLVAQRVVRARRHRY